MLNSDPWHEAHELPGSIVSPVPDVYFFPLVHSTGVSKLMVVPLLDEVELDVEPPDDEEPDDVEPRVEAPDDEEPDADALDIVATSGEDEEAAELDDDPTERDAGPPSPPSPRSSSGAPPSTALPA